MFNENDYPKFSSDLCIGDEVYIIDLDKCGHVTNIRIDTDGVPIITVEYLTKTGNYRHLVLRYCELRAVYVGRN